ncbi:MAG TPA: acetate--CoA ligase family protein [Nocardioidaceae bacterium]|nr:acetate--CoA ligase family protein [Nocardioidaceae bacterium]
MRTPATTPTATPSTTGRSHLRRLLAPRSLVVVGGRAAEVAVRQSRAIGFEGRLWAVHPDRDSLGGVPCLRSVSELPEGPDAAFVAVPREHTPGVVEALAALGTGGVVCHASGFAEDGEHGAALQRDLVSAAGEMALVGPNCLGLLNYLDGAALWPEEHGGSRVDRGVAVIAQSGNIAESLTMQRRCLPLAQLVTIGNSAVTGVADLVEGMLQDDRVTAIGLLLEAVPDVARLSRVALEALRRRVPLVVLKSGSSDLGARVTLSHTSSLAGSDVLADALFERLGIVRVRRLEAFVETLKLLHVHGSLPGARVVSASCSGGEAAHLADLAPAAGVTLPDLPAPTRERLSAVLGDRVTVRNPLDYHTYIWGRHDQMAACFTALLGAGADAHLLLLDVPRADRCDTAEFETALSAFEDAHAATGARACVVASLPEGLPEPVGARLLAAGIAPMQGVTDCLEAVAAAARVAEAQERVGDIAPPAPVKALGSVGQSRARLLDEPSAKAALETFGLPVPRGRVAPADEAVAAATGIGYPVVVKAVVPGLAHKSEVAGVRVGLSSDREVADAVASMHSLGPSFLVEEMVPDATLEMVLGVTRDPQFGLVLTMGAGGVLAELLRDVVSVLLPATREDVRRALTRLRCWPLLAGFRGRDADVEAVLDAVSSVLGYADAHRGELLELEVNPLVVGPTGVVAVDALVRLTGPLVDVPLVREPLASDGSRR